MYNNVLTVSVCVRQGTISQYFVTSDCLVCEQQTKQAVCASCLRDPQLVAVTLASRSAAWESVQDKLAQVTSVCLEAGRIAGVISGGLDLGQGNVLHPLLLCVLACI